jgi:hypothetical protein
MKGRNAGTKLPAAVSWRSVGGCLPRSDIARS